MTKIKQSKTLSSPPATAEEVLADVPRVKDDCGLLTVVGKLRDLEAQLAEVRQKRSQLGGGDENGCSALPAAKFNPEQDGRAIFTGEKVLADLAGSNTTTIQHDLRRQEVAIEVAIGLQREVVRQTEMDTVRRICEKHRGEILLVFERVLDSFARLEKDPLQLEVLDLGLQHRGLRAEYRPTGWQLTGYESSVLHGGPAAPSLAWFIGNRKKTLGL